MNAYPQIAFRTNSPSNGDHGIVEGGRYRPLSGSGYSSLIVSNRGAYIQRAILIRCQDYRKALPTADAILSMQEYERILQAELCDRISK
jgi:hypothetical protein